MDGGVRHRHGQQSTTATLVAIGGDISDGKIAEQSLGLAAKVLAVIAVVVVAIGLTMAWILFFKSYEAEFNSLRAADLNLDQQIYNEQATRLNKDMLLMQEQARQREAFEENVRQRISQQNYVNMSLIQDIDERIANNQNISDLIGNETQQRQDADTLLQERIDNATAALAIIKAFQADADAKFMVLMQNITDLDAALIAENTAMQDKVNLMISQRAIIDTALVQLVNELNQEMMERMWKDDNLTVLVNLATYGIILNVNGVEPVISTGLLYLVSTDTMTMEILNGTASNEVVIDNHGIFSFSDTGIVNFARANELTQLFFTADNGFAIVSDPGSHTITINSTFASGQVASNFAQLSATIPYGTDIAAYVRADARSNTASLPGMASVIIDDPSSAPLGNGVFLATPLSNFEKGLIVSDGSSSVMLRYGAPGFCVDDTPCTCVGAGCPVSAYASTVPAEWHCKDTPMGNMCMNYCTLGLPGIFECGANYGPGWYCAAVQSSPPGRGKCLQAGSFLPCNPALCELAPALGNQWGCLPALFSPGFSVCEQKFCYYDTDCSDKWSAFGYYTFCVNGRCVPSSKFNGDNYPYVPMTVNAPIPGQGAYPLPPPTYIAPYPGYASPVSSENSLPLGPRSPIPLFGNQNLGWPNTINTTCTDTHECPPDSVCAEGQCKRGYFQTWDGQNYGFRIPFGEEGTWMVKVTVTIRVLYSQINTNQNVFFDLYIDRGNGWEKKEGTFWGANSGGRTLTIPLGGFPPFMYTPFWISPYVSLSTTVFMSTLGDGAMAPGTPLYVGWIANTQWTCDIKNRGATCATTSFQYTEKSWSPWYRVEYEITKIA